LVKASTSKKQVRKRAPGGGRKPLPPEARTQHRMTVRLYADEYAIVVALCARLGISEGELIRRAVRVLAEQLEERPP